ncbi:ATP-grasp domain-containing protein [Myxococcus xanthus]|uniref:ATP-grasp domain-containing protein n=1 Tax=Myxococcus xanthus TaxID=34 RepID=UPI001F185575|nr:ATP-grasp domain-containing protein [Myxococcus xanthus]
MPGVEAPAPGRGGAPDRIPSSFEFRTFWWNGELVGWGPYWWQGTPYTLTPEAQREALGLGREVARRQDVPFLVVDVAQEVSGRWIVIECNDGQESGYAGISPFALWRAILDVERGTGAA